MGPVRSEWEALGSRLWRWGVSPKALTPNLDLDIPCGEPFLKGRLSPPLKVLGKKAKGITVLHSM